MNSALTTRLGCPSTVTVNSGARRSRIGCPLSSTTVTSTSMTSTPERNTGGTCWDWAKRWLVPPTPAVTNAASTVRMARIRDLLGENRIVMQYACDHDPAFFFDRGDALSSLCHVRYAIR